MSQKQQVYRKKGEAPAQEETKAGDAKPREDRGGYRGGNRGGRGGQRGGNQGGRGGRPQTAYQDRPYGERKPQYQRKQEDAQEGEEAKQTEQKQGNDKNDKNDRKANNRNTEIDENTYYYKYYYAPRPKFERITVTAETEVPSVPAKEERKKQPDQNDFDKKMRDLDNQIEHLRAKIRNIGQKKKEVLDGGKVSGSSMTYKDFLREKFDTLNELRQEKRGHIEQLHKVQDKIKNFEDQRQTLRKGLSREHQDPEAIKKSIIDLERRFETTTLKNNNEEKKILNDIKSLKASVGNAEKLLEIKPQIDALYTEKKEIREKLNVLSETIEGKDEEINKIKKEMDEAKEQRQDIKQQLDQFEEDIQKVKDDLQKLYDRKNETREEYFKAKLEFEIQRDEIHQSEWIAKQKLQVIEREKMRLERIESRKQALLDRPNPYLKEIETCDHLIAYCQKLKVLSGLVQAPVDEQIKQEQKQIISQLNKEEVKKKLQDGKLERVMTKKEREEAALMVVGGKKKGGKKPKAAKESEANEEFQIDITLINKFGFLKISPPLNKESLDSKINELTEKRAVYDREGDQRLKDEEEKLGEGVLEEEEPVYEKRERNGDEEEGERRGGRGGRGFRGGRGGFRGGDRNGDRPQTERGRGRREQRDEYQDDEDEGYNYTETIHNKQGRRANKKENLDQNENNYPTLS